MAAGYISRAPPNATYNNHVIEHRAGHERHQKKYQTSTATVVEAPPAKADLRSILQNGTDGDAATFEGGLKGLFRVRKVGDIPWSLPPSGKSFHCSQLLLRQKQPRGNLKFRNTFQHCQFTFDLKLGSSEKRKYFTADLPVFSRLILKLILASWVVRSMFLSTDLTTRSGDTESEPPRADPRSPTTSKDQSILKYRGQ